MSGRADVLVVGAGPVGLTLACELARYGARVRIIDRAAARSDKSKALVVWSRTTELLDRMGIGDHFAAAGVKGVANNIFAGKARIARVELEVEGTPHPYALMLPQSETERLLETHLQSLGVTVERQVELRHFEPGPDAVAATLRQADGREATVQAAFLAGCDGAHSTVRHALGMAFEGDTLPTDFLLADLHLDGLGTPPDEMSLFLHEDGVLVLFPMAHGRYRLIADAGEVQGNAHRPDPTLEEVQEVLDRRGPGGVRAHDPVWLASFRINERKVADYRAGRVFLAGDAAHVHSPAGGQGMNTGMQDAFNLAWKLALVCRSLAAPEKLLDSYSAERSPVGRQVLTDTGRMTSLAVLRSGVLQAIRNHALSLLFGLAPVRRAVATKFSELSIGYPHGPLTQPGSHGKHPEAGQRAPVSESAQPVGAGDTPRFAIFAEPHAAADALMARHSAVLEPNLRPPFSEGGIWLVRPDGYVAMVATRRDWDRVGAYLDSVTREAA